MTQSHTHKEDEALQVVNDERIAKARAILARLCDKGLLSMSVPVRDDDEDMVLSAVIDLAASRPVVAAPQAAVDAALKLIGGPLQVSGQKGLRHIETGAEHPLMAGAHIASGKNGAMLEAICTVVNAAIASTTAGLGDVS